MTNNDEVKIFTSLKRKTKNPNTKKVKKKFTLSKLIYDKKR